MESHTIIKMYNTSILNELISQEVVTDVSVEQRAEVMSITCGNLTLEMGADCSPYCNAESE